MGHGLDPLSGAKITHAMGQLWNPLSSARGVGWIPCQELRSHMPWGSYACAPQLESACAAVEPVQCNEKILTQPNKEIKIFKIL